MLPVRQEGNLTHLKGSNSKINAFRTKTWGKCVLNNNTVRGSSLKMVEEYRTLRQKEIGRKEKGVCRGRKGLN